jgi:hypothetical protein
MERHEILDLMSELKLTGMRAAFDDILATGVKRQHRQAEQIEVQAPHECDAV